MTYFNNKILQNYKPYFYTDRINSSSALVSREYQLDYSIFKSFEDVMIESNEYNPTEMQKHYETDARKDINNEHLKIVKYNY